MFRERTAKITLGVTALSALVLVVPRCLGGPSIVAAVGIGIESSDTTSMAAMPAPSRESGNTYARGMSAVLSYLGSDISYDRIMGLTGVAFILQVDTSGPYHGGDLDCAWWPNDHWGFELGLPVLTKAVGWEFSDHQCDWEAYKTETAAEYGRSFAAVIEKSLQSGKPVLARSGHCFIVTGVDDQEPPLLGYGTRGKSTQYGQKTTRMDDYPCGLYIIGEKVSTLSDEEVDLVSLRHIIALFNEQAQGPEAPKTRFSGRQAWAEWLRLLRSDVALRSTAGRMPASTVTPRRLAIATAASCALSVRRGKQMIPEPGR